MVSLRATCAIACVLLLGRMASAQDLPRGQIVDDVKTVADATQGYALYLPSNYTPDKSWPLLMGFHPGGRGRQIVEKYRAAAERYGYIVAASNNSRNGPWEVSQRAVIAMARDLGDRFATDPKRLYATGHSGGARVAMQLALQNPIAGVIASSAGFPDFKSRSSVSFPVFATAGTYDFNYMEIRLLDRALRSPHRTVIFEGGHTLPPDDVAMAAIAWLELQGMKSGARMKDEVLLSRWWDERHAAIQSAGDSVGAVRLLENLIEDFTGHRDVTADRARLSALSKQPEIKRTIARERDDLDAEIRVTEQFVELEAQLRNADERPNALARLRALLVELDRKAGAGEPSLERDRARRILRMIAMGIGERVQDPDYLKLLQQYRFPR